MRHKAIGTTGALGPLGRAIPRRQKMTSDQIDFLVTLIIFTFLLLEFRKHMQSCTWFPQPPRCQVVKILLHHQPRLQRPEAQIAGRQGGVEGQGRVVGTGAWQGVAMDSLKNHQGPACPSMPCWRATLETALHPLQGWPVARL
jgi:hypothetical protein